MLLKEEQRRVLHDLDELVATPVRDVANGLRAIGAELDNKRDRTRSKSSTLTIQRYREDADGNPVAVVQDETGIT